MLFCFFKQKTAYELRISDWSSDVCSSDLYSDQPYVTTRGFFQSGEANRQLDTEIPLTCPVRLLHGEDDGDVPSDISPRLSAALASAAVQVALVQGGDQDRKSAVWVKSWSVRRALCDGRFIKQKNRINRNINL